MKTYADKKDENRSRALANSLTTQKSGGKSAFQFVDNRLESKSVSVSAISFVDNRPEVVAQRKLQGMPNEITSQNQNIANGEIIQRKFSGEVESKLSQLFQGKNESESLDGLLHLTWEYFRDVNVQSYYHSISTKRKSEIFSMLENDLKSYDTLYELAHKLITIVPIKGNVLYEQHPSWPELLTKFQQLGFKITPDPKAKGPHTVVRLVKTPIEGKKEMNESIEKEIITTSQTTFSDMEHEFRHAEQQKHFNTTQKGHLYTEVVSRNGTGREKRYREEEMKKWQNDVSEVEAYMEEFCRLWKRTEFNSGIMSLDDILIKIREHLPGLQAIQNGRSRSAKDELLELFPKLLQIEKEFKESYEEYKSMVSNPVVYQPGLPFTTQF